jgi:DNA repair exonuclease SbcCD ATPase subunit
MSGTMKSTIPYGSPIQTTASFDDADPEEDFWEEGGLRRPPKFWGDLDIDARAAARQLAREKHTATFKELIATLETRPTKGRKKGDSPPIPEHMVGLEKNKERIAELQRRIAERAALPVPPELQTNQQLKESTQRQRLEQNQLDGEIAALTQEVAELQAARSAQLDDGRSRGSATGTPRSRRSRY